MSEDALVLIAHSYISQFCPSITQDQKAFLEEKLDSFIENKIDLATATAAFKNCGANEEPLIKVSHILSVQSQPLPSNSNSNSFFNMRNGRKIVKNWTSQEDRRLICALHKFGNKDWVNVSLFVGNNRTKAQCAQRWNRVLDPRIEKGSWPEDEEKKLVKLVEKYGLKNWKIVASEIGTRTDTQCRYHYNLMIENKKSKNKQPVAAQEPAKFDKKLSDPQPAAPQQDSCTFSAFSILPKTPLESEKGPQNSLFDSNNLNFDFTIPLILDCEKRIDIFGDEFMF